MLAYMQEIQHFREVDGLNDGTARFECCQQQQLPLLLGAAVH